MSVVQFDIYCDVTQGIRPSYSDTPGNTSLCHLARAWLSRNWKTGFGKKKKKNNKEIGARPSEGDGEMPQVVTTPLKPSPLFHP